MEMAKIGAIEGDGCCRLSLTDEDKQARDLFDHWCKAAGCDVRVDQFGNMFAIRPGRLNHAPAVLVGSHLDTQPHGGRFDGVLGVLAGLEIVRALNDANIETQHPIVVVNWTNEEGVRFKPGLTGSSGFVGSLDMTGVQGLGGADFFAELARIGYAGQPVTDLEPTAYYELHIEQGPFLERVGAEVGIVTGVQGVRWFEIELLGRDSHAGTTPMTGRSDSFMAASAIALELRKRANALDPEMRFTIGRVEVSPNSTNTVPGRTSLFVDLRHSNVETLDAFEQTIPAVVEGLAQTEQVRASVTRLMEVPPVRFSADMQARLHEAAQPIGVHPPTLGSGAMHDASNLATAVPTAMVFVQSRDGISHNPQEWSEANHVALACEILAQAVLAHAIAIP
jgi:N-carbamoyl-L-amino-acid hydrolase